MTIGGQVCAGNWKGAASGQVEGWLTSSIVLVGLLSGPPFSSDGTPARRFSERQEGDVVSVKKVVFVASPYSHPDREVRYERFTSAQRAVCIFSKHNVPCFVPIAMTGLFDAPEVPYENWINQSFHMLHNSSALVVLTLPGWDQSRGVALERKEAERHNIPEFLCSLDNLDSFLETHGDRLRALCNGDQSHLYKCDTGAVRDRRRGKGRFDLLPPNALLRWALRLELGAIRYSENNYLKGLPLSNVIDSGLRHINMFLRGDNSEDHLGAWLWNAGAAVEIESRCLDGLSPSWLLDVGPGQRRDWRKQEDLLEKERPLS